jgi:hypothetical protein
LAVEGCSDHSGSKLPFLTCREGQLAPAPSFGGAQLAVKMRIAGERRNLTPRRRDAKVCMFFVSLRFRVLVKTYLFGTTIA